MLKEIVSRYTKDIVVTLVLIIMTAAANLVNKTRVKLYTLSRTVRPFFFFDLLFSFTYLYIFMYSFKNTSGALRVEHDEKGRGRESTEILECEQ